ncbi:sigma factor [Streptomyces sp. NPDC059009]|uniref:sigma factor n=1 Tax=Streptomyces sp. NPDC059009 TaxID=3346694 RepID=UPI00367B1518
MTDGPAAAPATASYARIYEAEQHRLLAYARSLTGSPWVADDLVAEAHFRVWRRLAAGHEIENVPAYLMTTVRHLASAVGRSAARETPHDPQAAEPVERVSVHGHHDDAADPATRLGSVDLLARVLDQLPERWVQALWLAEAEGQPLEAVGRRIGAGRGATAVLLHRAREGMRQAFLRAHPGTPDDPACEPHWERMPGHIRGETTAAQSERLVTHLDGCADCRSRLALLTRANNRLPALAGPALLIFVLGGAGKFLVPVMAAGAAGAAASGSAGSTGSAGSAGSAGAASAGHGGPLNAVAQGVRGARHGIRHVLTAGGKLSVAVGGAVGVSVAGAAVAAGLVLGGLGDAAPASSEQASVADRGASEEGDHSSRDQGQDQGIQEQDQDRDQSQDQGDRGQSPGAGVRVPAPAARPSQPAAKPVVPAPARPAAPDPANPPAPEQPAPQPDAPQPDAPTPTQQPTEPAQPPAPAPTPPSPTPVDPTPVDPTPVDPTPVDPTPVDPTPVEPTPDPDPGQGTDPGTDPSQGPTCVWLGPVVICHSA